MLRKIYDVVKITATVLAPIAIPVGIIAATGSLVLGIILAAVFALGIGITIATGLVRLSTFVTFRVGKTGAVICAKSLHSLEVQRNGEGKWKTSKTLIFLKTPERRDLRDLVSTDRSFSPQELHYSSPDSDEIERVSVGKHHVAIFWSPRTKIYRFEPYDHSFQCLLRTSFTELANYKMSCFSLQTGYHKTTVRTPYPIEHVIAFEGPRHRGLYRVTDVCKYGLQRRVCNCPQPRIADDRHGFEWEIHTPELGREYFCVFFRGGGIKYWTNRVIERRLSHRILRFLRRRPDGK